MKNKILSIGILLVFVFTSLVSVNAIAPTPHVDLDDYQILSTDSNNVNITGTVSICVGQDIGIYDSNGKIMYSCSTLPNTKSSASFSVKIPSRYLKDGTNKFKVKSTPIKNVINGSNPKSVTVTIGVNKKDQVITANNLTLKPGETKNINASVNSGLSLIYLIENPDIATVSNTGDVTARQVGTTRVVISQPGNGEYKPANTTVNIIVSDGSSSGTSNQTISTSFDKYQFSGTNSSTNLNAKASSGLSCTYKSSNSSIVTVDSKGKLTAKKAGTATVTITQSGNSKFKEATKVVIVKVPKLNSRASAVKPLLDACKTQAKWMKNYKYGSYKPVTIEHTKKHGTCVTYAGVALQRANLLKNKQYVWHNGKGYGTGKLSGKYGNSVKNNFKVTYIKNKKLKTMKKTIQPGDVLMVDDNKSGSRGSGGHIFIYTGSYKGNDPIIWDNSSCSRVKKGKAGQHTYSGNRKLRIILRPNTYNINTTCVNGTISETHMYLAGQKATITYSPMSGKKVKSIKVDGKNINTSKYKNSYTFNNLNANHKVEVVFN